MQNLILRRYSQSKNNPTSNEEIWRSNIYKLRNVLGPEIMKAGLSEEEREKMGLSDGLVRISIGLDNDIDRTYNTMLKCMKKVDIL